MKGNKYDDLLFFQKYSQMEHSKSRLSGAGEWHELKKLLPDFSGKTVLDLGCGYGWHCKYAAAHGAAHVLGTDILQKMLETAQKRNPGASMLRKPSPFLYHGHAFCQLQGRQSKRRQNQSRPQADASYPAGP